jgi:hypothetical protein
MLRLDTKLALPQRHFHPTAEVKVAQAWLRL